MNGNDDFIIEDANGETEGLNNEHGWTHLRSCKLITLVYQRRGLWDKKHQLYNHPDLVKLWYDEIADELKVDAEKSRLRWEYLQEKYLSKTIVPFPFEKEMQFLELPQQDVLNFDLMCRICLSACRDDDEDAEYVMDDYAELIGYKINPGDEEPRKTCQACLLSMLQMKVFIAKCHECEDQLSKIKKGIKNNHRLETNGKYEEGKQACDEEIVEKIVETEVDRTKKVVVERLETLQLPMIEPTMDVLSHFPSEIKYFDNEVEVGDFSDSETSTHASYETNDTGVTTMDDSTTKKYLFQCYQCKKKFDNIDTWLDHKATAHGTAQYFCDICNNGYSYKTKLILAKHMEYKHLGKVYPCNNCEKVFKSEPARFYHRRKFHETVVKVECKICNKKFPSIPALTIHHGHVHGSKSRLFDCTKCEKSFAKKLQLYCHMRTHEANQYYCPVCPKDFINSFMLRLHVTKRHPEFKLPPPGTFLKGLDLNNLEYDKYGNVISQRPRSALKK